MLAGGADAAIIPSGIGGFIACKALSKRNDEPEAASRPWDKHRDGFVMGDGAGVIIRASRRMTLRANSLAVKQPLLNFQLCLSERMHGAA